MNFFLEDPNTGQTNGQEFNLNTKLNTGKKKAKYKLKCNDFDPKFNKRVITRVKLQTKLLSRVKRIN